MTKKTIIKRPEGLTDKQWQFVLLLPQNNWNQTKTYREVYDPNMGDNAAAAGASRLLRNGKIRNALKPAFNDAAMGLEEMLAGIADIARDERNSKQDRLRAYDMIGRTHAAFTENLNIREVSVQIDFNEDGKDG